MEPTITITLDKNNIQQAFEEAYKSAKIRFLETLGYSGFELEMNNYRAEYYYPMDQLNFVYSFSMRLY